MTVTVNQWPAYVGSFRSGFDVRFPVVPGAYLVIAALHGVVTREKRYTVHATAGYAVEVWLEHSRTWGNFTSSPRIVHVPLGG